MQRSSSNSIRISAWLLLPQLPVEAAARQTTAIFRLVLPRRLVVISGMTRILSIKTSSSPNPARVKVNQDSRNGPNFNNLTSSRMTSPTLAKLIMMGKVLVI